MFLKQARLNNFTKNISDNFKFSGSVVKTFTDYNGTILVAGGFANYKKYNRNYLISLQDDSLSLNFSGKFNNPIRSVVTQADGKILIGGSFTVYGGVTGRNYLIRLNSDLTLDTSFCTNAVDGGKFNSNVNCIVLQSDGKILIGGGFTTYGTLSSCLIRLNSDGTLDTDFSNNVGTGVILNQQVSDIIIQPDNKILIAGGFQNYKTSGRNYLARLNSDGTLDTAFCANASDGGKFTLGSLLDISLQSDGKIIAAGTFSNYAGVTGRNNLVRLNSDGTLDTAFCINAVDGKFANAISCISVQTNGNILVGGSFTTYGSTSGRNNLIRLNSDGTLDTAFCANASDGTKFNSTVNCADIQADGKILIGGSFNNYAGVTGRSYLIRLNSDGTTDTEFCNTYIDGTNFPKFNSSIRSIVKQSDDKLIIGGAFSSYGQVANRNRLVRLNSDGTLDTTFCVNASDGNKFNNTITYIDIQADGKILISGIFTNYGGVTGRNYLVRLNSDGTLDTSFCTNAVDSAKFSTTLNVVVVQSDGKILVGGQFINYGGVTNRNYLVRLNTDGTLDATFCANAVDGAKFSAAVTMITTQSDNKILVGGGFSNYAATTGRNRLVRLNFNGTLDAPFCINATDGSKFNSSANSFKIQSDDKILIGGGFTNYSGVTGRSYLIRLNSDGTLDTSFCTNAVDVAKFNGQVNSIAIQSNNKIIMGGAFTNYAGTSTRSRLIRLNSDGTLDTEFCTNAVDGKISNTVFSVLTFSNNIIIGGDFFNFPSIDRYRIFFRLLRLNISGYAK